MLNWLKAYIPLFSWIGTYSSDDAKGDLKAGITAGFMLIPQGMAYAVIAGVPPIYGLYAGLIPLVVYPFVGSSKHLSLGPVALDMIIIGSGVAALGLQGSSFIAAVLYLTFSAGLIQLLMGSFRLGFIFSFFSRPVIAGFTLAAPLIIAVSQVGNFTGVVLSNGTHFFSAIYDIATSTSQIHLNTLGAGIVVILLILIFKKWISAIPGSIAVVILGIAASWFFDLESYGIATVDSIPTGLPEFTLPFLEWSSMRDILSTSLTLALVQFMTVASLGKVFAMRFNYQIEPNRELMALGSSNIAGSFFQSLPISASFSRSSAAVDAGIKSPLSNWITAGVVALTLLFFTDIFSWLPMPVLAGIIIVSALNLIDVDEMRYLFEARRSEGNIALITAGSTLVIGIQEGILIGIGASMVYMLFKLSRPNVAELGLIPDTQIFKNIDRNPQAERFDELLILRVDAAFSFVNADFFKDFILKQSHQQRREINHVIIDGNSINDLDTTAIDSVYTIVSTLQGWGIELYFTGLKGPVRDVVMRSGLKDRLGGNHFFHSTHEAVKTILKKMDADDDGNRVDHYQGQHG